MATTERRGGRGTSGHQSRPPDEHPLPDALKREATELWTLLQAMVIAYRGEHDAGWPPGSAGLGIQGGQSDATQAAYNSPEAKASRATCRAAAKIIRQARRDVRAMIAELTSGEVQAERPSADSVVARSEFDRSLHERRERELRT